MKRCEICDDEFQESRQNQKYCQECGKNPEKMRRQYDRAEYINKVHAGDLYKPVEWECQECGKKTISNYAKTFCGIACREIHWAKTARCPICNKLLSEHKRNTGRGFCSDECKKIYQTKKAIEKGNYIPCQICKKEFISKNYSNIFCSRDCFNKHNEIKKQSFIKKELKYYKKVCTICTKQFVVDEYRITQQFCSRECGYENSRIIGRERKEETKKLKEQAKMQVKKQLKIGTDLNLCTICKTSQRDCERFTSNFVYMPTGAKKKEINGKFVVVECPKFKE